MNSIDNVLEYIKKKTEEKIFEIKNKNISECKKIFEKYKLTEQTEEKLLNEKILNTKNKLQTEFETNLKQFEKETIATTKEKILNKTFDLAIKTLCEDENSYYYFVERLLNKNVPKENFIVVFGSKDEAIFKKISEENFKEINFDMTKEFAHGFKIICKKYVLNFTLENIFLEKITKIKIKASLALEI